MRRAAADATERLREIIGLLRDDGVDGGVAPVLPAGGSVAELVGRAVASGMDVRFDDAVGGGLSGLPLPDVIVRAACRVVQEGLTNAAKHALGRTVRVLVREEADYLLVAVVNDLPEAVPDAPSGYGLIGLDERVRLVGGRFDAGPSGGEFVVRAWLPVRASVGPVPPSSALRWRRAEADAHRVLLRGLVGAFWLPAVIVVLLVLLYLVNRGWG